MIVILGGGVAGASLAWALTQRGRNDVVVFDPAEPGSGSTGRATGGFRTQFATPLNIELSLRSREFFAEHADRIGFRSCGYAFVAHDTQSRGRLDQWRSIQQVAGLPVRSVSAAEVFPGLVFEDGASCNFCHLDGVHDPFLVLALFREEAETQGAQFRYGVEYRGPPGQGDIVVIASGIWSPEVGQTFGLDLNIRREERHAGYLGNLPLPADMPLGIDMDGGWVFRRRDGNLLLVSPAIDSNVEEVFRDWIDRRLPDPAAPRYTKAWSGFYEITPDHHPLVGSTEVPGIWASCGFSGHGVMHSPAVAQSLAAMILGETPPIDISALSPFRTVSLSDPTQM